MKVDLEQLRQAYQPKPPARADFGIAIIGLGYAAGAHIPAYLKAGWNVVSICDKDATRLESVRNRFGFEHAYQDWRQTIDRPDVDIVDLAITQEGRTEIVQAVASLGKHILIQKPFAHKIGDALAMVDACEKGGVKLAVNQNARFAGCNRAAKWLLEQGMIGTPFFMHELWVLNSDAPCHKFFSRLKHYVVFESSVHYLDLLRWWAGREPEYVSASLVRSPVQQVSGELGAVVTLEFDSMLTGHLTEQSATTARDDWAMSFRIDGSNGAIKGGYDFIPNSLSLCWQTNMFIALWSGQQGSRWSRWNINDLYWVPDAHIGTMGELMDAIAADREPSISGRDNLNTVRLCLAAYLSAQEKRAVKPGEIQPGVELLLSI